MPQRGLGLTIVALVLGVAAQAHGQDLFAADTFHGLAELRLAVADGERSWVDGGFGKTALSGAADHGWRADAGLSQALIEWRQRFNFAVGAVVSAQLQPDLDPKLDLDEAYLKLKAPPLEAGRLSARAGVFYPPVSLEHSGVGWTTPDTLSASALNTWIGEEVKVAGAEASFERSFGNHELAATAAVFGWNDTSGTLLSFRGWALHADRAGAATSYRLPPLSAFMVTKQAGQTDPMWEIDHRAGYYGALEWRPPAPVRFNAVYYDNVGNRRGVKDHQWAWETRFLDVGMRWEPDARTRVLAQAMTGETFMGYATPATWLDMGFRAAYVLASRDIGRATVTGRLDGFDTHDRTWRVADNNDETGWAATAAWRYRLSPHADILLEAQHVRSKRPARSLAGQSPDQDQTVLQSALRLGF
jgi:hypothetical protein